MLISQHHSTVFTPLKDLSVHYMTFLANIKLMLSLSIRVVNVHLKIRTVFDFTHMKYRKCRKSVLLYQLLSNNYV